MMNIIDEINKDISKFTQDNPYPKSMTKVDGRYFRHYEFGEIFGFCLYNEIFDGTLWGEDVSEHLWFGMILLTEDDGFWRIEDRGINVSYFWNTQLSDTLKRLQDWAKDHIFDGYNESGKYVSKILRPIDETTIR